MADPVDPALALAPDPEAKTAADVAESGALASLTQGLRDLAEDTQTLVEAELAYQSARAAYVWNGSRGIVVWLLLAGAAAFFALVALVVGLLLALIPVLGVWGALGVVAAGLAIFAAIALKIALLKVARVRAQAIPGDPTTPPRGVAAPEPLGPPSPPELTP